MELLGGKHFDKLFSPSFSSSTELSESDESESSELLLDDEEEDEELEDSIYSTVRDNLTRDLRS